MVIYIILGVIGWLIAAALTRKFIVELVVDEPLFLLNEYKLSAASMFWPLFWLWMIYLWISAAIDLVVKISFPDKE